MPHKLLCDENIPNAVTALLAERGFDVLKAGAGVSDNQLAKTAQEEKRIIITSDSDFSNILDYPPEDYFGIVRIKIHPPIVKVVNTALEKLFKQFKEPESLYCKLAVLEPDRIRIWEK